VLPGVSVGANAILAAGSVAAKDVQAATIAGGVPAQRIADRERPTA
jgi:maltose O-acetyltransferase